MSFGEKLRMYRKSRNMTQGELAERIGLARKHLSDIENEADPPPKIGSIVQIIKELDLTREEAIDLLVEVGIPSVLFNDPSI